jgi:hypothetical protein
MLICCCHLQVCLSTSIVNCLRARGVFKKFTFEFRDYRRS